MPLYRMPNPRYTAPQTDDATAAGNRPETLFARMIRLWIEHHERLVEFRNSRP